MFSDCFLYLYLILLIILHIFINMKFLIYINKKELNKSINKLNLFMIQFYNFFFTFGIFPI